MRANPVGIASRACGRGSSTPAARPLPLSTPGLRSTGTACETQSARETISPPSVRRANLLGTWRAGIPPEEYLFKGTVQHFQGGGKRPKTKAAHNRNWLRDLVRLVCETAGVRVVPPHGLRGVNATLLTCWESSLWNKSGTRCATATRE